MYQRIIVFAISLLMPILCAANIRFEKFERSGPYLYWTFKFDQVMGQKDVLDNLRDAANNPIASRLLETAGAYVGIPPNWTKAVLTVAKLHQQQGQEGQLYHLNYPQGYTICRADIRLVSIVTLSGPRGSTWLTQIQPDKLYIEAWTQRTNFGGRTWVEADYSIVLVEQAKAAELRSRGICAAPPPGNAFRCRGNGTGGDGLPACGNYTLMPQANRGR